jgi:hypothetical protein
MTQQLSFAEPIGLLLVLALLAMLASGVLAESSFALGFRTRLGGGPPKLPRRVATAAQRG